MFSFRTDVSVAKTSRDMELSCKIIAEFQTNVLSSMISFIAGKKEQKNNFISIQMKKNSPAEKFNCVGR